MKEGRRAGSNRRKKVRKERMKVSTILVPEVNEKGHIAKQMYPVSASTRHVSAAE